MSNLYTLSQAWLDAKSREEAAKAERIIFEEAMVALAGPLPEVGQKTFRASEYKVEIKQSLTIKPKVPAEFRTAVAEGQIPSIIVQPTLYDTGVLRLRKAAMDQDEDALATYGKVLPWLDIKPAKTSFSIVKTTN